MKYPPKAHQESNLTQITEVIKRFPLATLISLKNNKPFITHVPLMLNDEENKLIGHVDKNNPHVQLLQHNKDVTAVFSGPQSYISPTLFSSEELPTWNYVQVHITGTVKKNNSKQALINSLVNMTRFLELPNAKFNLETNNKKMHELLNYIHFFEIEITQWEGKFKLSRNKSHAHFEKAKQALINNYQKNMLSYIRQLSY